MADTLLSFFPTPDDLLRAEVDELAPVVLVVAPGVMQNEMFNIASLITPLYPLTGGGYPSPSQVEIRRALAEALSWLENQGTIIKEPDQPATWYRLTRRQGTADLESAREWVDQWRARGGQPSGTSARWVPGHGGMTAGASVNVDLEIEVRRSLPVQRFLVTTPLSFQGASLISLTLRFLDAPYHNQLPDILAATLAEDFEGWASEPLASGAALLDRLAIIGPEVNPTLREAIIEALNDRAAALQFSDPHPFRYPNLENLAHGIHAFARLPARDFRVGLVRATTTVIILAVAITLSVGAATVLVTDFGNVITARAGQHVNAAGRTPP